MMATKAVSADPIRPVRGMEQGSGSSAIVSALRKSILDGNYAFNDRLPSERQLAEDFSAARGTVREALRRLEEMDLVKRRVGSGTFVKYRQQMDHDAIVALTSPLELIDVRIGFESQMIRLAVLNASAREIRQLHDALDRLEVPGIDREEFTLADEAFHLALAQCTQNPMMVWLYQHINDVRTHAQWSGMRDKVLTPGRIREYNIQHRELYQAIVNRDVASGLKVIKEHMEKARNELLGAHLP